MTALSVRHLPAPFSPPACPGQFFELDVYHSDGTPLTSDQIFVQLEKIWNSSLQANKEPVGILTSNHRNSWAKAYNTLIKGVGGGALHFCSHRILSPPIATAPGPGRTAPHQRCPWGGGPTPVPVWPHFSPNPQFTGWCWPHFTDEETETQSG